MGMVCAFVLFSSSEALDEGCLRHMTVLALNTRTRHLLPLTAVLY